MKLRCDSNYCETVFVQVEQIEILFQMQGKWQKLLIADLECLEVCYGIVTILVMFFYKVVMQESFRAEMVQIK